MDLKNFGEHWLRRVLERTRGSPNWSAISRHPCITPRVVRAHPEHPWDDYGFVWNDHLPWEFLRERIQAARARPSSSTLWNEKHIWHYLSEHPSVTLQSVRDFPEAPWSWEEIFQRAPLEDLLEHCRALDTEGAVSFDTAHRYVMTTAGLNTGVPLEYRLKFPDIWWNFAEFSAVDPLIVDHALTFPNLGWSGPEMSRNPHISLDMVCTTHDDSWEEDSEQEAFDIRGCPRVDTCTCPLLAFHWDWIALSENRAIQVQEMLAHRELPWQWAAASKNPTITVALVEAHPELEWDGQALSANPGISLEALLKTRHEWVAWAHVSSHPEVGWDTVEQHKEVDWVMERLLVNPMPRYKREWMAQEARRWCAARRLQRFARDTTCNPTYPVAYRLRSEQGQVTNSEEDPHQSYMFSST